MPPDTDITPTQLLAAQLERVSSQMENLPRVCAKLESVVDTTSDLEGRLREVTSELRTRDEAQGKMIDDLRERMRGVAADTRSLSEKIGGLQETIGELKSDLNRRVLALEQQVKATFDTQLRLGERVRSLEAETGNPQFEEYRQTFAVLKQDVSLLPEMRLQLKEILEFLPWMKVANSP
mgnify:CR=1 FL=1